MMRSSAYNRLGVLMGTSSPASDPRCLSLRGDSLPMIPLISSQGDFCATAIIRPLIGHGLGDLLLTPHRINRDHRPCDVEQGKELGNGRDFIGLLVDFALTQHQAVGAGPGTHHMDSSR